jgi:hypothetical protein
MPQGDLLASVSRTPAGLDLHSYCKHPETRVTSYAAASAYFAEIDARAKAERDRAAAAPAGPPQWVITDHAVTRYAERFGPDQDRDEIRALLERLSVDAVRTGQRRDGKHEYTHPLAPWMGLVVSCDARYGKPALVTVVDVRPYAGVNAASG